MCYSIGMKPLKMKNEHKHSNPDVTKSDTTLFSLGTGTTGQSNRIIL